MRREHGHLVAVIARELAEAPPVLAHARAIDRDQALETALQLFWRHGYEGTSIADLTAAMGVTPPSLYTAFGSKEQLYREALDRYGASYGSFTARALIEEPTARHAVERILRQGIEVCSGGPEPRGCMLATGGVTCSPEHALVAADLSRRRLATIAAMKKRFDRAIAEGELSPSTDTQALAAYYAAVVQGIAIQARDRVGVKVLRTMADLALRAWPAGRRNTMRSARAARQGARRSAGRQPQR